MFFQVVFYSSGLFLDLWFLMYLFQIICTSSRFFSELECTSSALFSDQSGFFLNLSWFLLHLVRVLFWSNRVVSGLAPRSMFFLISWYRCSSPYPGCFLINPGSFWICLGTCSTSSGLFALRPGSFWTCMYLIRVVFWSIRVVSGLALRSVFSWSHGTDVAPLHVKHKNML